MDDQWLLSLFPAQPVFSTDRLLFRRMLPSDSGDLYAYASDPQVSQYLLWSPHESETYTRNYLNFLQKAYRKGQFHDWALIQKDSGRMIGTGGFTRLDLKNRVGEIGYVLSAAQWGRGLGRETVRKLLSIGFDLLELERIEARYMVENTASRRVMEVCGLRLEGVHRKSLYVKNVYRDIGVCAILREEYYDQNEKQNYETLFADRSHWYDRLWENDGGPSDGQTNGSSSFGSGRLYRRTNR